MSGTSESIAPFYAEIPQGNEFQKRNYACIPYLDTHGYVTYAYNISGGSVIRWFRDSFASHMEKEANSENLSIYDLLNRAAPGEPGNLMFLPYLQGIGGTPLTVPDARGLLYGMSMNTSLPDIYRAILEGLTFEMACNLESLKDFDINPLRMFACGGGARSALWLSIKADAWNREIIPVLTEETGALGSAVLGFAAITGEKDLCGLAKRFIRHGEPVLPNAGRAEIYAEKLEQYKRFRQVIIEETLNERGKIYGYQRNSAARI